MLANHDNTIFFPIYGQFAAIWKLDSGCIVCKTGVKVAVGHRKFLTELMKQPISYVDKFSKMSDSKKNKIDKILKIVESIWNITHNSQHKTLLNVSMINGKCKIKQKWMKKKDKSRLISKET